MALNRAVIVTRANVTVAPTLTIIFGPQDVSLYDDMLFELINTDISQTLNAQVEASVTGSAPWTAYTFDAFNNMGPGVSANECISMYAHTFIRLTATASGAGLTATISATLLNTR